MIDIKRKEDCCGCNACGDACAHGAITFKTDNEGFWYPEVDKEKCVDCGLCEKVCPILHEEHVRDGNDSCPQTYILQLSDNVERFNSTSGCLYPVIAKKVIEDGGYVAGHIFDDNFGVKGIVTNKLEDLEKLRNSKYLQSDVRTFYKEIRKLLVKGEKVFASGCPCQMAALKTFLRKDYPNLITADFTCMGIDSPKAFRKYLDSLEDIYGSKIKYFKSKCKEIGWRRLTNKVVFENAKTYFGIMGDDPNLIATFMDILVRPSCYHCKFKGQQRISDISFGDYWTTGWSDYTKLDFSIDDNSGTSYAMLNNNKAKMFFNMILPCFKHREINVSEILKGNPFALKSLPSPKINRSNFYEDLNTLRFDKLIEKYNPSKKRLSCRQRLGVIKRIIKYYHFNPVSLARFIYYNVLNKHVDCNIFEGNILLVNSQQSFSFEKRSKIIVKGECKFLNSFAKSRFVLGEESKLYLNRNIIDGGNIYVKLWKNAIVKVGTLTEIHSLSYIEALHSIEIGDFCRIEKNVTIADNNQMVLRTSDKTTICADITIGIHCLLGDNSIILKGTQIGEETILEKNSVVEGMILSNVVVSGSPAKVVAKNISWKNNI